MCAVSQIKEETIINKTVYTNPSYNLKVKPKGFVDVVVVKNGVARKLLNIDKGIINPKKVWVFKSHATDDSHYTIYHVSKASYDWRYGGNKVHANRDGSKSTLFIRASYSYSIINPEDVVALLNDSDTPYTNKYLGGRINAKIEGIILREIMYRLNRSDASSLISEVHEVEIELQDKMNSEILCRYGILMEGLQLILEDVPNEE